MKNFNDIYEQIYRKYANTMEEMRKSARNGMIIIFAIAIILGVTLTVLTGHFAFLMIAVIIIVLYISLSRNQKEYKKFFKENVVKTFIKEYSETLDYRPQQGMARSMYNNGEFERL